MKSGWEEGPQLKSPCDVCSSEGAIRRVRLQSHLLIWFLIFPKYFPSIASYCIVFYCIVLYCLVLYCIVLYCIALYCIVLLISQGTDSSLSRQSSLIFFTSTADSNVSDNHTLHLKSQWGKVWTIEHGKSQSGKSQGLSFQKTEGADWRKKNLKTFLLEKEKIPWKVCPGLETKTH